MPPRELPVLRAAIDAVDEQVLELLNQRALLVKEVGELKTSRNQPIFVPHRESQIIERLQGKSGGPFPVDAIRSVFHEIIGACLSLEQTLRVGFLGPEATFTHMAARSRFGTQASFVPAATIAGVFAEIEKGLADLGVVPIENSTDGVVNSTLDVFMDSDLVIQSEIVIHVSQCLLTRTGKLDNVQKVYSHPQALGQCRGWLAANLPKAALIEVASTALAARLAKDDPVAAAVASELAGHMYDLRIAKEKINDEVRNVTRFLVIGHKPAARSGRDKTSLMLSVKDQPGILYKVLEPLAKGGINLTRIESRPSRKRVWDYVFFVDLDGHFEDPEVAAAITALKQACEAVKVLGSYPRYEDPPQP
jgi:chorismate mutase/prephenate dehydratase